jgi:hypothetical protein
MVLLSAVWSVAMRVFLAADGTLRFSDRPHFSNKFQASSACFCLGMRSMCWDYMILLMMDLAATELYTVDPSQCLVLHLFPWPASSGRLVEVAVMGAGITPDIYVLTWRPRFKERALSL